MWLLFNCLGSYGWNALSGCKGTRWMVTKQQYSSLLVSLQQSNRCFPKTRGTQNPCGSPKHHNVWMQNRVCCFIAQLHNWNGLLSNHFFFLEYKREGRLCSSLCCYYITQVFNKPKENVIAQRSLFHYGRFNEEKCWGEMKYGDVKRM